MLRISYNIDGSPKERCFAMGKILGIRIENYGTFKSIEIGKTFRSQKKKSELGNVVAVIGPSGNGKSTLADAFGFISECLEKDVETACDAPHRGGFDQILSQGAEDAIRFELYYRESSNTRPITYELTIGKDKDDRPYVKEERLRQRVQTYGYPLTFLHLNNGKGFAFEGLTGGKDDQSGNETGERVSVELSNTRKLGIVTLGAMKQYTRIEKFLAFLRSWYLCYFSPEAARQTQQGQSVPYLNRDGSNLNNVAQYMYRENRRDFEKILKYIQSKLENVTKIEPQKLENGQIVLRFYQKGFASPFYSNRMSDGTLKLFAYYVLLHEKNPRQLVFIEEPENGLYHQYLGDLAREMIKNVGSGYGKQLFVTTHSPFFVNALSPEQVWVLSKDESGFTTAKRASDYDFVKDLVSEGITMGDLWYSKYFG